MGFGDPWNHTPGKGERGKSRETGLKQNNSNNLRRRADSLNTI